jgi:hypothetical protein
MPAYQDFPWRVGRSVGRTLYAVRGPAATKEDVLIGVMDSPFLAREAVDCHNARLGWAEPEVDEAAQ